MKKAGLPGLAILGLIGLSCGPVPDSSEPPGSVLVGADHHMHLMSEASAGVLRAMCQKMPEACGEDAANPEVKPVGRVIELLDAAGLGKGVVMSLAYFFGVPELADSDLNSAANVRSENEFVARQVALHADRLVGMFSINPLSDYALDEVAYWAARDEFVALKLHFANSDVDLRDEEQLSQVAQVFSILNDHQMPVAIHLRNRNPEYGAEDASIFIKEVLAKFPDVPVQLAHLGGWGGYDPATDGVVETFLNAIAEGALDRERVAFDVAAVALEMIPDEALAPVAGRLQAIGFDRVLFASDWDAAEDPGDYLETLRKRVPLADGGWDQIVANQAAYFK